MRCKIHVSWQHSRVDFDFQRFSNLLLLLFQFEFRNLTPFILAKSSITEHIGFNLKNWFYYFFIRYSFDIYNYLLSYWQCLFSSILQYSALRLNILPSYDKHLHNIHSGQTMYTWWKLKYSRPILVYKFMCKIKSEPTKGFSESM